jgi:aryl-alcohol dehydrogenase-like predicted oxidoreductase
MNFRQLGNSGLTVSEVGLGCNNFGQRCDFETSKEVIFEALDQGINFFDTADIYGNKGGSESYMGKILKGRRDEIVLATKFGMDMGTNERALASRRYLRCAIEASLKRLQTDHIDLYQLHRPDPLTPIEETLEALDDLVRSGKVLYIGSSNLKGWQIAEAAFIAKELGTSHFVSAQNLYSVLERGVEDEVLGACQAFDVGFLPFFPLASGLLTGKFRRNSKPPEGTRLSGRPEILQNVDFDFLEALEAFARDRGMQLLDLAFAYLLYRPQVSSVIAGATSREQIKANVATQSHRLSENDYLELQQLLHSHG